MAEFSDIRRRHIWLMRTSAKTISHILQNVSRESLTTLRDGENGWTVLEVLAHLRDFDMIFRHRAQMILTQDNPQLPAYDHEGMAIASAYNQQNLAEVLAQYLASREETVNFFRSLNPEDWERSGIHPERGRFSLTDAAIQVGMHDNEHLEQITRILTQENHPEAWLSKSNQASVG
jgi:uncharacterized damage-inducible protein DinB